MLKMRSEEFEEKPKRTCQFIAELMIQKREYSAVKFSKRHERSMFDKL